MKKMFTILVVVVFLFSGCGDKQPTLSDAVKKSFKISKGMSKEKVSSIIKQEPTSVQRIDDYEIWKYEGIETDEDTEVSKYLNLIIKFKYGNVSNIGTFSCKVPKQK